MDSFKTTEAVRIAGRKHALDEAMCTMKVVLLDMLPDNDWKRAALAELEIVGNCARRAFEETPPPESKTTPPT